MMTNKYDNNNNYDDDVFMAKNTEGTLRFTLDAFLLQLPNYDHGQLSNVDMTEIIIKTVF